MVYVDRISLVVHMVPSNAEFRPSGANDNQQRWPLFSTFMIFNYFFRALIAVANRNDERSDISWYYWLQYCFRTDFTLYRFKLFSSTKMDEESFPIIYSHDGYRYGLKKIDTEKEWDGLKWPITRSPNLASYCKDVLEWMKMKNLTWT